MSDKVVKGYVQLDFKVDNGIPVAPSIILSHYDSTFESDPDTHLIFRGTEIISYLKTYYPNEYNNMLNLVNNFDELGRQSYDFNIPGYIDGSQIEIEFSFFKGASGNYNLSIITSFYKNNSTSSFMSISGINLFNTSYESVSKEKLLNLFNRNFLKMYIAIVGDYTRTGTTRLVNFFENNTPLVRNKYLARVSTSSLDLCVEILDYLFHNKPEEKEDNIIGDVPFIGDNIKTDIDHPELPTVGILNGMHNMYQPDLQVIKQVNRALWSRNFIDNVIKIFNNPIESIVSLTLSPIKPPISENVSKIVVGNLPMIYTETGGSVVNVFSRTLTNQYGNYSFGKLSLFETFNGYLDYNSSVEIFLPYIGVQKLSIDDVMNKILSLEYNVDFFTGDFIATLKSSDNMGFLNSVLYHWKGNILSQAPLSASNFSNTFLTGVNTVLSVGTGNTSALINNVTNFKPDVSKGSNTSGNVGSLDNFNAYLILTKPIEDKPNNYNKLKGSISNNDNRLKIGMGYIVCEEIHIKDINATDEEKDELEKLFKSGVIL